MLRRRATDDARGTAATGAEGYAFEAEASTHRRTASAPCVHESDLLWRDSANSFVGREADLAEVRLLLDEFRLLTLTGPGGIGKSRLAVRAARAKAAEGRAELLMVDLSCIDNRSQAERAVLDVVSTQPRTTDDPLPYAAKLLGGRRAVVVLDNCEHVVVAAAHIAAVLHDRCPNVQVLATGRRALRVTGERVHQVGPLAFGSAAPDPVTGAMRLFLDRAALARRDLVLDEGAAAQVARIVAAVDGIPLAIELAAARTRLLGFRQIADLLDEGRLGGTARGADDRHQTMDRCLEWSYRLLGTQERILFRRLAVFEGPWDEGAAVAVCADDVHLPAEAVPGHLRSLVDQSLVTPLTNRRARFRMLNPLREYALRGPSGADDVEVVAAVGGNALRARHVRHFVDVAERSEFGRSAYDHDLRASFDAHAPDFHVALREACRQGSPDALRLTAALGGYWRTVGKLREADEATRLALAHGPTEPTPMRAVTLAVRANVLSWSGDFAGARLAAEKAVAVAEATDDPRAQVHGYVRLGAVLAPSAPGVARAVLDPCVGPARSLGAYDLLTDALVNSALCLLWQGDHEAAARTAEEGAAAAARVGLGVAAAFAAWCQASHALAVGEFERAVQLAAQMTHRTVADASVPLTAVDGWVRNCATQVLGMVAIARGDAAGACALARSELADDRHEAVTMGRAVVLHTLGAAELARGDRAAAGNAARELAALAEGGFAALAWPAYEVLMRLALAQEDVIGAREHVLNLRRMAGKVQNPHIGMVAAVGSAEADLLAGDAAKAELTLMEIVDGAEREGLVRTLPMWELLAQTSAHRSAYKRAARLIAAADAWRAAVNMRRTAAEKQRRELIEELLAKGLASEEAERERSAGADMTVRDAVAYVKQTRRRRTRPDRGWESLTGAERDVAFLAADGLGNPEIAQRLYIARATVKVHLRKVYLKLGITSRTELAATVRRGGGG